MNSQFNFQSSLNLPKPVNFLIKTFSNCKNYLCFVINYLFVYSFGVTIPTEDTPSSEVDGVRFDMLPIAHIKSSPNNTIIIITDHTGSHRLLCFKNYFLDFNTKFGFLARSWGCQQIILCELQQFFKIFVTEFSVKLLIDSLGYGRVQECQEEHHCGSTSYRAFCWFGWFFLLFAMISHCMLLNLWNLKICLLQKALRRGLKNVRVAVKGLGTGRLVSDW